MNKIFIFVSAVLLCNATAGADESKRVVSASVDMSYVSKYVWRGIAQTSGSAFQPSLTISCENGSSVNFWASWDEDAREFREYDYTLSYTKETGEVAFSAGWVYYTFPNTSARSTNEVFVTATLNVPLSPSVSVNYDTDEAKGFYVAFGATQSYPLALGKSFAPTLNLTARLGFGSAKYNKYWFFGVDKSAFTDLVLTAAVPYELGRGWRITPSVNYTAVLDGALRDAVSSYAKADNWCFGVSFARAL